MARTENDPKCVLDRVLVNQNTISMMKDVGLSIFSSLCGKNRGAFVLHPSDGKTYSCLQMPENILDIVGVQMDTSSIDKNSSLPIFQVNDANAIVKHYHDGNLTAADTVNLLDYLVQNVYESSSGVSKDPYACDISGLVTLKCAKQDSEKPIRAVTMAGVFSPARWATGGKILTLEDASNFYSLNDFKHMKTLGLNTVQIPVSINIFVRERKQSKAWLELLTETLHHIRDSDLKAILTLQEGENPPILLNTPVQNAARFAHDYNSAHGSIISALILPNSDLALLKSVQSKIPKLNVWIPINAGDFTTLHFTLADGASLDFSHTVTVADVASSNSQDDRAKMYYHETMACISRAPLEYSSCVQGMPVTVTNGFDLAVDNCHLKGISDDFQDFGQCDRFNETIDSGWWKDHRYSFAARQLYAYERGQGWSFATWKLWGMDPEKLGVLDIPAKLLSFQDVVTAGIMPSLFDLDNPISYPLQNESHVGLACLNPPNNDFVMGDATYAPTHAPPPSCGNGWWNFTTSKCDYWVPPITDPPTLSPTSAPCPVCSNETPLFSLLGSSRPGSVSDNMTTDSASSSHSHLTRVAEIFLPGVLLSCLISLFVYRTLSRSRRRGYVEVPEGKVSQYEVHV